jgi:hypothetical protein
LEYFGLLLKLFHFVVSNNFENNFRTILDVLNSTVSIYLFQNLQANKLALSLHLLNRNYEEINFTCIYKEIRKVSRISIR